MLYFKHQQQSFTLSEPPMSNLIHKARVIGIIGIAKDIEQTTIVLDVIIETAKVPSPALLPLAEGWGINTAKYLVEEEVDVIGSIMKGDHKHRPFEVLPLKNQSRQSQLLRRIKRATAVEYYNWIEELPIIDLHADLSTKNKISTILDELFKADLSKRICPKDEWLEDEEGIYPTSEHPTETDLKKLSEYLENTLSCDDYEDEPF